MTQQRPDWIPSPAENTALMNALDEEAESFIVSCLAFAAFFQTEVEFGVAIEVLKAMTEEMYRRKAYYEGRLDPISGKPFASPPSPPAAARMHGPPKEGGFYGGVQI